MMSGDLEAGLPLVAIVGRANVGKSTLVNRMVGRREAIEHPEPGVTRDRQGYDVDWSGARFTVVDTGGWEPRAQGLTAMVVEQARRAAANADLVLMVVDVITGLTHDDLVVARGLRGVAVPVMVVANKVDSSTQESDVSALARLGLGHVYPVSALHGRGSGDLLDAIVRYLRDGGFAVRSPSASAISVAIVGRPNAGKSSLFNRLVGEERAIVHENPGTTRDAVDTLAELGGRTYRFIDTAGMRRRGAKDARGPEYYGLVRSMRAIDEADIALHVIDTEAGPTEQDQKIAARVAAAGCACVVVLNKWDRIDAEDVDRAVADVRDELRFVKWAPIVRTSALTKRGMIKIAPELERVHTAWQRRIPTAGLNSWVREVLDRVPLGTTPRGRPVRIRYITQSSASPPHFVVFANGRGEPSGVRALERRLRERFDFEGTPIRISVRARISAPRD